MSIWNSYSNQAVKSSGNLLDDFDDPVVARHMELTPKKEQQQQTKSPDKRRKLDSSLSKKAKRIFKQRAPKSNNHTQSEQKSDSSSEGENTYNKRHYKTLRGRLVECA